MAKPCSIPCEICAHYQYDCDGHYNCDGNITIKKLEKEIVIGHCGLAYIVEPPSIEDVIDKINEIIDYINKKENESPRSD